MSDSTFPEITEFPCAKILTRDSAPSGTESSGSFQEWLSMSIGTYASFETNCLEAWPSTGRHSLTCAGIGSIGT